MSSLNPAPLVKNSDKKLCNHENKICSFCSDKNCKNKNNFFCYKCLYDYHLSHGEKCIPVEKFKAETYQNYIKPLITNIIDLIEKNINEMYTFLNNLENKKYKNIDELIKLNNLDLTFDLPLQINIYDRFLLSVRNKCKEILKDCFSTIQSQLFNKGFKLNLFNESFDNLNFIENLKENEQTYEFKSSTNFNLKGIGISSLNNKKISIEITEISQFSFESMILQEDFNLINSKNYNTILFYNPIKIKIVIIK